MSVLKKEQKFLHPLTDKWLPLIHRFAFRYKKTILEMKQESYILEWEIQQSKKKFETDKHKENYFKRALYRNLFRRANDWGVMERSPVPIDYEWECDTHGKYIERSPKCSNCVVVRQVRETVNFFVDEDGSLEPVESLIQMRSFDEVYYDELIAHTAVILAEKSMLAHHIFLDRMNAQLWQKEKRLLKYKDTWKELRTERYKKTSPRQFSQAVELIREVVRKELCFA